MNIIIENMKSPRSGRPVANQFVIRTDDGVVFKSYGSNIAHRDKNGNITLDKDFWDYSVTTTKYRNQFLGENTAETRKKIKDGTYTLASLNGN